MCEQAHRGNGTLAVAGALGLVLAVAGLTASAKAKPSKSPGKQRTVSACRPGPPARQSAPSARARRDIPRHYLALYRSSVRYAPGLDWSVLAGIGRVETNHGKSHLPGVHSGQNFAGAAGPMQFGNGTGKAGNSWARYGRGSVYSPANAIPAAARYLCAHGSQQSVRQAVHGYNHSWSYVDLVLRWAARYRTARA